MSDESIFYVARLDRTAQYYAMLFASICLLIWTKRNRENLSSKTTNYVATL